MSLSDPIQVNPERLAKLEPDDLRRLQLSPDPFLPVEHGDIILDLVVGALRLPQSGDGLVQGRFARSGPWNGQAEHGRQHAPPGDAPEAGRDAGLRAQGFHPNQSEPAANTPIAARNRAATGA